MRIFTNVPVWNLSNWKNFYENFSPDEVVFLDEVGLKTFEAPIKVDHHLFSPYVFLDMPCPSEKDVFVVDFSGRSGLFLLGLSGLGFYCRLFVVEDNEINFCAFEFRNHSDYIVAPLCYAVLKLLKEVIPKLAPEGQHAEAVVTSAKLSEILSDINAVVDEIGKLSCRVFNSTVGEQP